MFCPEDGQGLTPSHTFTEVVYYHKCSQCGVIWRYYDGRYDTITEEELEEALA